ncbi:AraC family transcriptional regulator [Mycolicibacterium sp. S2-37]|uniref:AraC family transcriptional regulator n=1 Tax=Mycolicibacterium sp. S2-37 TaxID=2810297 RepID=UPI001A94D5DF|nr:AraC family transcriptional regulator [Mycolicibacterium sp. S2-37]MBO0677258.1 AraC family transcriptional regulator [Mycolicibacterium sp. S2-37]
MERLNEAMALVEQQLEGEVDVRRASRIALMSEHHFRRLFSALAGIPLSEYVRRRRMTIAAAFVVSGAEPLQDLAVRFGYGSADAFSRAFRTVHGVSPERARRPGVVLRSQPRLTFTITIEGSTTMEYRIVEKGEFTLAGVRTRIPLIYEGINPAAAAFVEQIGDDQWARIADLSDQDPAGVLSVHDAMSPSREEGTEIDYYVAAATSKPVPEDVEALAVSASSWLVLESSGAFPEALQELWPRAFREWFPANPYQSVPGPEMIVAEYADDEQTDGRYELWIPVEKVAGA